MLAYHGAEAYHSFTFGRQLNGNFDLLRDIISEEQVDTRIQPGFPLERLTEPENFLSLLHYFGLLSIREVVDGVPRLAIPNQMGRWRRRRGGGRHRQEVCDRPHHRQGGGGATVRRDNNLRPKRRAGGS